MDSRQAERLKRAEIAAAVFLATDDVSLTARAVLENVLCELSKELPAESVHAAVERATDRIRRRFADYQRDRISKTEGTKLRSWVYLGREEGP